MIARPARARFISSSPSFPLPARQQRPPTTTTGTTGNSPARPAESGSYARAFHQIISQGRALRGIGKGREEERAGKDPSPPRSSSRDGEGRGDTKKGRLTRAKTVDHQRLSWSSPSSSFEGCIAWFEPSFVVGTPLTTFERKGKNVT